MHDNQGLRILQTLLWVVWGRVFPLLWLCNITELLLIAVFLFLVTVLLGAMQEAFASKVQHPRKAMSLFLKAGKGMDNLK